MVKPESKRTVNLVKKKHGNDMSKKTPTRKRTVKIVERRNKFVRQAYLNAGFPARFYDVERSTIQSFGQDRSEKEFNARELEKLFGFIDDLEKNLLAGNSLSISGGAGLGKTRLLCFIGREILKFIFDSRLAKKEISDRVSDKRQICFMLASEITDLIHDFNLPPHARAQRDALFKCDFLMLDDITKLQAFKGDKEVVFLDRVLRTRYHELLPTFITSQFPFDKLGDALSEPIMDLLFEMCESVTLIGDSWRR